MTSTTIEKPIRLTITVEPHVHQVFQRLAKASGMSLGKAMGEWLGDTIEAVEFTAEKVEQARAAPATVMREMHAYALGLAEETNKLMDDLRDKGREQRAAKNGKAMVEAVRAVGASKAPLRPNSIIPPSSNTGGKGTKHRSKGRGA
jgi:hypothetical protein